MRERYIEELQQHDRLEQRAEKMHSPQFRDNSCKWRPSTSSMPSGLPALLSLWTGNWFSNYMKLKDHRLMQYHNVPNWPPSYLTPDYRQEIIAEFGILRGVTLDDRSPNRCFLTVEMDGLGYVSWVKFDDTAFRTRFMDTVSGHLNKRMKEIGDLEISD